MTRACRPAAIIERAPRQILFAGGLKEFERGSHRQRTVMIVGEPADYKIRRLCSRALELRQAWQSCRPGSAEGDFGGCTRLADGPNDDV